MSDKDRETWQPAEHAEGGAAEVPQSPRYIDQGLLGRGGVGEVRRVLDQSLNRVVAMKRLRAEWAEAPQVWARFVDEAQATAQLQHPNIVPVHDIGRTADAPWFTMKEICGRTLGAVIEEVHAASCPERWERTGDGWTFRGLLDVFRQVCEAVAYAHSRGVLHRDLKPDNVMVGEFGEVLVVDWGLARIRGDAPDAVITDRTAAMTQQGEVSGTPSYMAPEQARGARESIDERTDVYALGAVLYQLLDGQPPYRGDDAMMVMLEVLAGPPAPPGYRGGDPALDDELPPLDPDRPPAPPVPDELAAICAAAMARDPAERVESAQVLAREIRDWLEGARLRERALVLVAEAQGLDREAEVAEDRAAQLRSEAAGLLVGVPAWAPESEKLQGWARQDEAAALTRTARRARLSAEHRLNAAFSHVPALPEAHAALAERHRAAHAHAERVGDSDTELRAETLLRHHAEALPPTHPDRADHLAWLSGEGALTLITDPPGAEVTLHRYVERGRRLVTERVGVIGKTPLVAVPLEMGSYLCMIDHPQRSPVRYPVHISRRHHWDGIAPGDVAPTAIYLPRHGELSPGECYVPAGWFEAGGDPAALDYGERRRLWCPGLVVRKFPITNAEFIEFLDAMVARGQEAEALDAVPRERSGSPGVQGVAIYGRDPDGRFTLQPDADGDIWEPDYPVVMINWHSAHRYGQWLAARTGLPWRLPGDLEWEKAARGVDGRAFPWGHYADASWCCMRYSHKDHPTPVVVDSFPVDESPYGMRGAAGNVRTWCADAVVPGGARVEGGRVVVPDPPLPSPARRVQRGGCWYGNERAARVVFRIDDTEIVRIPFVGFRLARSLN